MRKSYFTNSRARDHPRIQWKCYTQKGIYELVEQFIDALFGNMPEWQFVVELHSSIFPSVCPIEIGGRLYD
jgi:hypothetical protein